MEAMTRASATPARGASLPPSERTTPVQRALGERSGSCGNLKACDFGEKIRQLEAIGNRLRGEVDGILKDSHSRHCMHAASAQSGSSLEGKTTGLAAAQLQRSLEVEADHSAFKELTDISNEQHAIEAMKSQLEHLQHRLREPRSSATTSSLPPFPISPAPRSLFAGAGTVGGRSRSDLVLPSTMLERELRDVRDRCGWLEAQLAEQQQQLSGQAERHRGANEELKARLYELQTEHEQTQRLREEEQRTHQELVEKLRGSLQQLQEANRDQESTLLETNGKLDAAQQNHYVLESTLSQVRSLLHDVERRRGRPFFDSDPVPKQSVSLLAHTLERYIQESESEIENRNVRLQQADQNLEEVKRTAQLHREDLERTWKDRLHSFSLDMDAKQSELRSNEAAARRRADDLDAQVRGLRDALEDASRRSQDQARESEQRLTSARLDLENARAGWQEKRLALEAALDAAQREAAANRSEKEQSLSRAAEAEAILQSMKSQLTETKEVLEEEHRLRVEENACLAQAERQLAEVEKEAEAKRAAALSLERALETLREETALEITRIRSEGKVTQEVQVRSLSDRLSQAGAEREALTAELDKVREELLSTKRALEETTAADTMLKIQLEGSAEEKTHLQGIIGNRSAEVERLTAERDYYFRCLDEKTEEVSLLKAEKQRLIVQVSEKLNAITLVHKKLEDKMTEMNALNNGCLNQEMEMMLSKMAEKDHLLQELHGAREQLLRKLKAREKTMRDLENERERLRAEVVKARSESDSVIRERSQLYEELRESRKEALALSSELDKSRTSGSDRELELQQKVQELTSRFRVIEEEMRNGKTKTPPSKGPRVGARLMRESAGSSKAQLEGVKTRLRELEGRTVNVETERKRLKAENDRLCRLLQRVTGQNEKLSGELEFYVNKAQDLRDQLSATEADRDRLARDCDEARQQIEALETQVASSKTQIRDLAERLNALRKASAGVVAKAGAVQDPSQGHEMRAMLADVRSILSSHSHPYSGDQRSGSPVHSLLLHRNGAERNAAP